MLLPCNMADAALRHLSIAMLAFFVLLPQARGGTSDPQGSIQWSDWRIFSVANSALPYDRVWDLIEGADGALWVGTLGGLARFHEGAWQVFTAATSDLPDDRVLALTEGADCATTPLVLIFCSARRSYQR